MKQLKSLLLISALSLLQFSSVKSQGYIPMLTDSIYWDVAYADMNAVICEMYGFQGTGPNRYALNGDTTINGTVYKKFKSYSFFTLLTQPSPNCSPFAVDTISTPNSWSDVAFMREDSVNRKVYLYDVNISQEQLWYDFDAQVGDTIFYQTSLSVFIVDTVSTIVTLDGKTRKYFHCSVGGTGTGGYYVEGIGGSMGPFHEPFFFFEFGPWLMCVKDLTESPIYNPNSWNDCYNFTTGINSAPDNLSNISIFPNPATDKLNFSNLDQGEKIVMFNNLGEKVVEYINNGDNQVSITGLNEGIYFVCVLNNNIYYPIGKFVKL